MGIARIVITSNAKTTERKNVAGKAKIIIAKTEKKTGEERMKINMESIEINIKVERTRIKIGAGTNKIEMSIEVKKEVETSIEVKFTFDLKVNCFWLEHYGYDEGDPTKQYWKDNQAVWFDDLIVARRYIGPIRR